MLEANDYKEIASIMRVVLESDITPKLNLLAENQQALFQINEAQ